MHADAAAGIDRHVRARERLLQQDVRGFLADRAARFVALDDPAVKIK